MEFYKYNEKEVQKEMHRETVKKYFHLEKLMRSVIFINKL